MTSPPDAELTEDERDEYVERLAIMQYDGGMTRHDAENSARDRIFQKRFFAKGKKAKR
jgi:hypothetical protein